MDHQFQRGLTQLSACDIAVLVAKGEISTCEVVEAHIEQIEQVHPVVNAVVVPLFESGRRAALSADRHRAAGEPLGPLHGVPVTIKESLEIAGTPSTFGIAARKDILAEKEDDYVAQLRAAGAIILGKTNIAQCLFYYESNNPVYGRTNNPWNLERTPGGSSGGEGAIIAAGGSPLGLGTDIGGSIRVPAAFCGVTGLKPTSGRAPDAGRYSVPIGQRAVVSQVGVLARRVEDVALGTQILNGANREPPLPLVDYRTVNVSQLRIGYFINFGRLAASPAVARAVKEAAGALQAAGAQVQEWSPPDVEEAFHLYYALLLGDNGKGFKRAVSDGRFEPTIKNIVTFAGMNTPARRLIASLLKAAGQPLVSEFLGHLGYSSVDQHWQLVEAQMNYQHRFAAALDQDKIDVILSPAFSVPAFPHGASTDTLAGGYSVLYNLLGYPAGVVPVTFVREGEEAGSAGMPVGVQVAARPWREHIALAAMQAVQEAVHFHPAFPDKVPL